jgi:hypothetical protein
MEKCKSCATKFDGNYCNNCGTPQIMRRINKSYYLEEFEDYFIHVERGILYTLKELIIHPGKAIKNFIDGNRTNYYKPISFLVLFSGLYSLIDHSIGYHPSEILKSPESSVNTFIREHLIYFSLFQIFIMIFLFKKVFYRKAKYNVFEYFVVLCYSSGMTILFSTLGIIMTHFSRKENLQYIISLIGLFYGIWLLGQFMESKSYKGYVKSGIVKLLSLIIFLIFASIIFTILYNLNIEF